MSGTRTCKHIKVTGVRCGSPALRSEEYCYFHYRMLCSSRISHVALLENEEAIQVSLMEVVNSLLRGTIDTKRGELVLRALNTAVRNSRRVRFERGADMVREIPKDPVVPPRERTPSHEELDAIKKEMLAGYSNSATAPKPDPAKIELTKTDVAKIDLEKPNPTQRKPPMDVKQVARPVQKKTREGTVR
jgi:hypothetical protein